MTERAAGSPFDGRGRRRGPSPRVVTWGERIAASINLLPLPLLSFDPERAILLAGSSRSGTSWLGRVLSTAPGYCLLTEPLSLKMPGLRRAGFSWRTHVDPDADWPEGEAILRAFFRGKRVTAKLIHRNRRELLSSRGLVVKSVRASRLLPWLTRRFALRGIVLLIRHPCAVVSSQMENFRIPDPCREDNLRYLERHLPHLLPFARGLETEEERRALTWALDQHAPLSAPAGSWTRASYERLVLDGPAAATRLFASLGLETPETARERLRENSWQARSSSVDHRRASVEERLGVWRRRLTGEQIDRILAVVEAVGIRGFGRALAPDPGAVGVEETGTSSPAAGRPSEPDP